MDEPTNGQERSINACFNGWMNLNIMMGNDWIMIE